jgi:hypothetical protein
MSGKEFGLQNKPHEDQELYSEVEGEKWGRFPVKTRLVLIDEDLDQVIEEYVKPELKEGDILCIASKIISITKGFYVKESDIKVSWLANFLVRFVKKWPDDKGYAVPAKIQTAIDIVGIPRFLFAMFVGGTLKYLGFPGWFYRIAGHNINGIDGFIPEQYPEPLRGYGFLIPDNPEKIATEIEEKFQTLCALTDGNNVENHVIGIGENLSKIMNKETLLKIIEGNPQGQEGNTPFLIVRKV